MAARRKPEQKTTEEDESSWGPARFAEEAIPKETQMHIFRAVSEMALALDSLMPKDQMPEDVRKHALAAKKEFMLMARAFLDHEISRVERRSKETARAPPVKKIEVK